MTQQCLIMRLCQNASIERCTYFCIFRACQLPSWLWHFTMGAVLKNPTIKRLNYNILAFKYYFGKGDEPADSLSHGSSFIITWSHMRLKWLEHAALWSDVQSNCTPERDLWPNGCLGWVMPGIGGGHFAPIILRNLTNFFPHLTG